MGMLTFSLSKELSLRQARLAHRLATSHFQFSFLLGSLRVDLIWVVAGALKLEVSVPANGAHCLRWSSGGGRGAFSGRLSFSPSLTHSPSLLSEPTEPSTLQLPMVYTVSLSRRTVTAPEKVPGLRLPRCSLASSPFTQL